MQKLNLERLISWGEIVLSSGAWIGQIWLPLNPIVLFLFVYCTESIIKFLWRSQGRRQGECQQTGLHTCHFTEDWESCDSPTPCPAECLCRGVLFYLLISTCHVSFSPSQFFLGDEIIHIIQLCGILFRFERPTVCYPLFSSCSMLRDWHYRIH